MVILDTTDESSGPFSIGYGMHGNVWLFLCEIHTGGAMGVVFPGR